MAPKRVAIIGAGPSGLVTAKTLLRNFTQGTFAPVVFDCRNEVGGLWPNDKQAAQTPKTPGCPGTLDPQMRTNLSRFTVAFSDLSWETVMGDVDIPIFPQARQVGRYLAAYAERYIPKEVLRLGSRVVRTARTADGQSGARWRVQWVKERFVSAAAPCRGPFIDALLSTSAPTPGHDTKPSKELFSEDFDFLVVASGYFARPYVPTIPGIESFTGQAVHSSALQKGRDSFKDSNGLAACNVAVIGGSMSGVEAASAAALDRSTAMLDFLPSYWNKTRPTVYHIYSRPFWTLPTYLPHEASDDTVSFLPLDLAMYDLGRRPPGPIEYALGPIPEEKAAKTNSYFSCLLGPDYEKFGHMQGTSANDESSSRPPWVAIGNEYAEYVRSGAIKATMGRAVSVHSDPQTGLASIQVESSDHSPTILENISHIVMATGFTPFEALSFLPDDVLATLEYSTEDPFLPLVLDQGGTLRSEMRDIGFVGFYRGPYWGAMEMQARFLGKVWADDNKELQTTESQRQSFRVLRQPDFESRRGQFPMGDYVGLMESFANVLGISRTELSNRGNRTGPVIPARYVYGEASSKSLGKSHAQNNPEAERTLGALGAAYACEHDITQTSAALAIFRALQGTWKLKRWMPAPGTKLLCGNAVFHPRYPSDPAYDREYVCEEYSEASSKDSVRDLSICRLSEGGTSKSNNRIEIWPGQISEHNSNGFALSLTSLHRKKRNGESITGEYTIHANSCDLPGKAGRERYQYTFNFNGVSITSWERLDLGLDHSGGECMSENSAILLRRTSYER